MASHDGHSELERSMRAMRRRDESYWKKAYRRAADIDTMRNRYPFAIVWTPIHPITWFMPFVGHMGICDSRGICLDFTGQIGVDDLAFGRPTRYLVLDPSLAARRPPSSRHAGGGGGVGAESSDSEGVVADKGGMLLQRAAAAAPRSSEFDRSSSDGDDSSSGEDRRTRDDSDDYYDEEGKVGVGDGCGCCGRGDGGDGGGAKAWDWAVLEASRQFEDRCHMMVCGSDCHSHVAVALDLMRYRGWGCWNKVALAAWVFFGARHTSWAAVAQTWGFSAALLAFVAFTHLT